MAARKGRFTIASLLGLIAVGMLFLGFWPMIQSAMSLAFKDANILTAALIAAFPAFLIFLYVALPFVLSETETTNRRRPRRRGRSRVRPRNNRRQVDRGGRR